MGKLRSFNFITLDGYYKGLGDDISWNTHRQEENEFAAQSMKPGGILLFGRVTYQMMAGFWTSPAAIQSAPAVANGMNEAEKIVFSKTLNKADWQNTRLMKSDLITEIQRLKEESPKDMTILGSGSLVSQLSEAGLMDEYGIMIDPVAIGQGSSLFNGLTHKLQLTLTNTRTFKSGVVLLNYSRQ